MQIFRFREFCPTNQDSAQAFHQRNGLRFGVTSRLQCLNEFERIKLMRFYGFGRSGISHGHIFQTTPANHWLLYMAQNWLVSRGSVGIRLLGTRRAVDRRA